MWRRLVRLAYPILCGTSVAICLATIALWARSTHTLDRIRTGSASRRLTLHVKEGEVYVDIATASRPVWAPGSQHIHAHPAQFRPPAPQWSVAGFGGGAERVAHPTAADVVVRRRFVVIPLWLVVFLTLVPPVLAYDARRLRRAAAAAAAAAAPPASA